MSRANPRQQLHDQIASCVDGKNKGIALAAMLDVLAQTLALSALHAEAIDAVIDSIAVSLKVHAKGIRDAARKPKLSVVRGGKSSNER
jgi:cobalamin biosynthesis protein CbiG